MFEDDEGTTDTIQVSVRNPDAGEDNPTDPALVRALASAVAKVLFS